jgi:hypothetical protein
MKTPTYKCIVTETCLATHYEVAHLEELGLPTCTTETVVTFSNSPIKAWRGIGGVTKMSPENAAEVSLTPILMVKQLFKDGKLIKEEF